MVPRPGMLVSSGAIRLDPGLNQGHRVRMSLPRRMGWLAAVLACVSLSALLFLARVTPPSLRGARMYSADLVGTQLCGADLTEADLRGSDLSWANLRHARLGGADLRRTALCGACLQQADLRGARLEGTNLDVADLGDADLSGARFSAATTWPDGFSPQDHGALAVIDSEIEPEPLDGRAALPTASDKEPRQVGNRVKPRSRG